MPPRKRVPEPADISADNEFALTAGENLPNHSVSEGGKRAKFIRPIQHPIFRTRQSALRFMAWLDAMSVTLPDEDTPATYEQIQEKVQQKRGR